MTYITIEDITTLLKLNIINDLSEDDYQLLNRLESFAVSELEAYLTFKYDVIAGLKSKNQFLIMLLLDILIYHFESRISHTAIDTIREERYKKAIDTLYNISAGKIIPNLPLREQALEYISTNMYNTNPYKITQPW